MPEPLVKIHLHDAVGTVILNRPDRRNALSRQMVTELDQALHDLHGQRRVRAVVMTGAGSAFCSGFDLNEMHATSLADDAQGRWFEDASAYRDLLETMLRFPKPLIAAVNGPALAAGAGLVLACDVVIAEAQATFGLPEPRRGLVAGVVAPLLTFRVGGGLASYLLLSATTLSAEAAYARGLFHEIVEHEKLWARAAQICAECAQCAPEALLLTKRMLNETVGESLSTFMSAGAAASATSRTTEAASEGLKAFVEKRPPVWP